MPIWTIGQERAAQRTQERYYYALRRRFNLDEVEARGRHIHRQAAELLLRDLDTRDRERARSSSTSAPLTIADVRQAFAGNVEPLNRREAGRQRAILIRAGPLGGRLERQRGRPMSARAAHRQSTNDEGIQDMTASDELDALRQRIAQLESKTLQAQGPRLMAVGRAGTLNDAPPVGETDQMLAGYLQALEDELSEARKRKDRSAAAEVEGEFTSRLDCQGRIRATARTGKASQLARC
jgi:hypothetical protein